MISITYAITVCNESWQLQRLLNKIYPYLQKGDQVLIQSDSESVTSQVEEIIENFRSQYKSTSFSTAYVSIPLDGDFASFKNNLSQHATGQWIFQIDADEYPTESLLTGIQYIVNENSDTDVILTPRINTVRGITDDHVQKWGWTINKIEHPLLVVVESLLNMSQGAIYLIRDNDLTISLVEDELSYYNPVINFPDYQWRLYQNKPTIRWVNKVHEVLSGFESYSVLPADITWCLIHDKDIQRQEHQNKFYESIEY